MILILVYIRFTNITINLLIKDRLKGTYFKRLNLHLASTEFTILSYFLNFFSAIGTKFCIF